MSHGETASFSHFVQSKPSGVEGPGLSPRHRLMRGGSGGMGPSTYGGCAEPRPGCLGGRWTLDLGTVSQGLTFPYPNGFSFCFKISFRPVRASLNVTCHQANQ